MYNQEKLVDNDKNKIIVLDPGEYNHDSGPDFFNARLLIADTIWAGNVEIHTKSSHFDNHGHQNDPAFNNVILHVVADNDKHVFNAKGEEVLTVEISFDQSYYEKYIFLVNNPYIIACQDDINKLDDLHIRHWLSSLVVERFQSKTESILKIFAETGNDWDETFYHLLARYFGFRVNTEPFEMLAAALPFKIIRKHADNLFQIEALLFGTAGLLETGLFKEALSDDYYLNLIKEYTVLSAKYSLRPLHGWLWKFSRLRPSNFPTVRLSQLASMLSITGGLFSKVLEASDINMLKSYLKYLHLAIGMTILFLVRKAGILQRIAGPQAADILLINAVLPVIFVYGHTRNCEDLVP